MTLYCPIRKIDVAHTKEEEVRQALLLDIISHRGYPLHLIAIEKSLSSLPHLQQGKLKVPNRRLDLLVYAPSTLTPLLMIEYKGIAFRKTAY